MIILFFILAPLLLVIPVIVIYWVVRLAIRHGLPDGNNSNKQKTVYKYGFRYTDYSDEDGE